MDTSRGPAEVHAGKAPDLVTMGADDPNEAGILVLDTSMVQTPAGLVAGPRRPPHLLDERGASPGCSSLMKDTKELVVGREEGVFSYSIEDRLGAAGFEGEKQCISAVGR